jgi:hypothetical protein
MYCTDPPSVQSQKGVTLEHSIFDSQRLIDALQRGLIDGIPPLEHPNDDLLIATVIHHGMPKWSADQMRYNPALRLTYYLFWLDVQEAAKGNKDAAGRVDGAMTAWIEMRKDELISDTPNHTIGLWER